ncbi:MAG: hypothetical protein ACE5ES_05745 [Candidatus Nanoarchaeia archaeon]
MVNNLTEKKRINNKGVVKTISSNIQLDSFGQSEFVTKKINGTLKHIFFEGKMRYSVNVFLHDLDYCILKYEDGSGKMIVSPSIVFHDHKGQPISQTSFREIVLDDKLRFEIKGTPNEIFKLVIKYA